MAKNFFFSVFFYSSIVHLQYFTCTAKWVCCRTWLKWLSSSSIVHIWVYTYIFFPDSFPWEVIARYWVYFPMLYSKSLLFIHFMYGSVYLSITCMLSHFSRVWLLVTLWTIAHQTPLSKGFSKQEDWSGLPHPPPEDLPNPGTELVSPISPALAGGFFTTSLSQEAHIY